ncbi:MAG: PEP-CTERM sorting domain-containing protein [Fimbriimonadia bacterium]|jgi:hypothetical protein
MVGRLYSVGMFLLALLSSACGQVWWEHQVVARGLLGVVSDKQSWVNSSGLPTFTGITDAGYTVFKGSENISAAVGGEQGLSEGINDAGQITWRGGGAVWVDTTRISDGLIVDQTGVAIYAKGITLDGRPLWSLSYSQPVQGRDDEVFLGRESLRAGDILGTNRVATEVAVSPAGYAIWYGKGDATGQRRQVFRGTENVSLPVLGPQGYAEAHDINDRGEALWTGWYAGQQFPNHMTFVNDREISAFLGSERSSIGRAINSRGQVLWEGWGAFTNFRNEVFLDERCLSLEVFGARYHEAYAVQRLLSDGGYAMWYAYYYDATGSRRMDVFVNERNISEGLLGDLPFVETKGVDDFGRGLWTGRGFATGFKYRAYLDRLDLSADARGGSGFASWGLAMGRNGHALWADQDPATGEVFVWLSTPVPEPSGGVGVSAALGLVLMRKRRTR